MQNLKIGYSYIQNSHNYYNTKNMEKAIELAKGIPTLAVCNNCDELIGFAINKLNDYPLDFLEFQGDTLEVTKTDLSYAEFGIIKDNTLISISSSAEGFFDLHAVKSPMSFNDNFPCIVVPNYVREELIATLKGEW